MPVLNWQLLWSALCNWLHARYLFDWSFMPYSWTCVRRWSGIWGKETVQCPVENHDHSMVAALRQERKPVWAGAELTATTLVRKPSAKALRSRANRLCHVGSWFTPSGHLWCNVLQVCRIIMCFPNQKGQVLGRNFKIPILYVNTFSSVSSCGGQCGFVIVLIESNDKGTAERQVFYHDADLRPK